MSFYAAHLFILSEQLDQMKFMRNINNEIVNANLTLVDSGLAVPQIAQSCGEWIEHKGENYRIKVITYEYSMSAVNFLEERTNEQCSSLEEDWVEYHAIIQDQQDQVDEELDEIRATLFQLSEIDNQDVFNE